MKFLLKGLLFVSVLILSSLASANQSAEAELGTVVELSVTPVSAITIEGQVYMLDQRPVFLKPGEERRFGESCVRKNLALFTRQRTCSWEKVLKATNTGLVVVSGVSSSELLFRLDVMPAVIFVLMSLFVLVSYKPIFDTVMILILVVSLIGAVVNTAFGSWPWVGLFVIDLIMAIISAVKIDMGASYLWRMPVIFISLAALYLSA